MPFLTLNANIEQKRDHADTKQLFRELLQTSVAGSHYTVSKGTQTDDVPPSSPDDALLVISPAKEQGGSKDRQKAEHSGEEPTKHKRHCSSRGRTVVSYKEASLLKKIRKGWKPFEFKEKDK